MHDRRQTKAQLPDELITLRQPVSQLEAIDRQRTTFDQTSDALRQSEIDLKKVQAAAHVGHWTWDLRSNRVSWSDEMHRIFGVNPIGFSGDLDEVTRTAIHPDDREKVAQANVAVSEAGQPAPLEYRVVWPDQSVHTVYAQPAEQARDEQGHIIRLWGIVQDITERKQADARILRLNRLYATLSQINQTIVRARDRDTLYAEICRVTIEHGQFRMAWIGLIDETEQRVKPVTFAGEELGYLTNVRITYRDEPAGYGPTGTAIREGRCVICQDIATNPLMTPWRDRALQRGYRSSASVPFSLNHDVVGALTVYASEPDGFDTADEQLLDEIGLDISFALDTLEQEAQRRRAESALSSLNLELEERVVRRTQELATANERLTELDRLKSKFVSNVSHELRTPVTSLGLYIDLLEHGKPEKRDYYVARLQEQMARLHKLINDILDLSRLERDLDETGRSPVDINAIVEHVSAMERVAAEMAGLTLTCETADNVPAVVVRPDQLARAITNLVSNAIKYTRSGSVRVQTYVQGEHVGIQVTDTGLGIAPEDVPHLFERFYRGREVAQSNIPGTGLGLSIVKEIVESHAGTVEVESQLGVGSTFRIWLPMVA